MSTTPSSAKAKRTAASTARTASKRRKPATVTPTVSAEQRHEMIAERAYLRAELRGFRGGNPLEDWLEGEKEVDALLSQSAD
jgi:hypothetical protein